ncbi:ASST-domain-containing protein [Exophiala viscosa]|uniref:ASST-domain-containing protein n=1 Tax=Exophiala viscosa TaxID=2486360 RepID=UPI002194095E|nr:ASST-domain-containing protein [Exophiala viscosa]
MLITAYNTTPADLTSVGGPKNGWVLDSIAAEVNITTGEVLFTWSPLAHLKVNQSHYPLSGAGLNQSNPYDFFHINAIELVGENYLINSRHFWSTFLVNPKGEILWEINGETGGDFGTLPEGGTFSWQHFARVQQLNSTKALVSWFANNNDLTGQANAKPSTGLSLLLTLPPNATSPPVLVTNFTNPHSPVDAWSQGSFQYLPNNNKFIGYGSNAVIAEYGPFTNGTNGTEGQVRWAASFGSGDLVSSYRAYKQVWHATPATKPSLVVLQAASNDTLTHCAGSSTWRGYVSWNGATDVTKYIVYTGSTNTTLTATGQASKTGFETEFVVPSGAAYVQVGAVENNGTAVTRKSSVVAVGDS